MIYFFQHVPAQLINVLSKPPVSTYVKEKEEGDFKKGSMNQSETRNCLAENGHSWAVT